VRAGEELVTLAGRPLPSLDPRELSDALDYGGFVLHFQPTIDLSDGSVVGVEALARWQHPTRGLLSPGTFLPVAKASGLVGRLGEWVVREAARHAARWQGHGASPLRVWVNLAAAQLDDGDALLKLITSAMAEHRIDSRSLGIEVTESSVVSDLDDAVRVLQRLRTEGLEVALDDFGTGYSSLAYLRRLPVTSVKIDQSFVGSVDGSLADAAIVEAVIDLSHALGMRAIVEGVEHIGQVEAVMRLGADRAQGFYFSPPVPVERIDEMLGQPWCGVEPPATSRRVDPRAADLPGFGGPRARLLLAALDAAPDSVLVLAAEGSRRPLGPRILYANAAFEHETGYRATDVIGKTPRLLQAPDTDKAELARLADALDRAEAVTIEVTNQRANGSVYPVLITTSPVVDERGIHTHWLQVRRDLSAQRDAEEALRRSAQRTEHLLANTADLVSVIDAKGTITYVNRQAYGLLGRAPADLIGTSGFDLVHPDDLERAVDSFAALFEPDFGSAPDELIVLRLQHQDGSWIPVEVAGTPLFDDPSVEGLVLSHRDLRVRTAAEEATESRRRHDFYLQSLAQLALDRGAEGFMGRLSSTLRDLGVVLGVDVVYADYFDHESSRFTTLGAWCRPELHTTRVSREEHDELAGLATYLDSLADADCLRVDDLGETPTTWQAEREHVFGPSAQARAVMIVPLRVAGRLTAAVGVEMVNSARVWSDDEASFLRKVGNTIAQILERQRIDLALRRSEARLSALFANAGDLFIVTDTDGRIQYCSPISMALLGRSPEAMAGRSFADFLHPDDVSVTIAAFDAVLNGRRMTGVELRAAHANGTYRWFEVVGGEAFDAVAGGYVFACREITQRRISEEAAKRRAEFDAFSFEISQKALDLGPVGFIASLDDFLGRLGHLLEVEATYTERIDGEVFTNVGSWTGDGVSPEAADCAEDGLAPAWLDSLRRLEPIVLSDTSLAPPDLRADIERFPIADKALVAIPLSVRGHLIGNLGVSMFGTTREWRDEEITLLRKVGETLSHTLERQRADDALRVSEARLSALFENTSDAIGVLDRDGRVLFANGPAHRLLAYGPDNFVGRSFHELVHPDDLARTRALLGRADEQGHLAPIELRLRRGDGEYVWFEINTTTGDDLVGGMVCSARDITERKRAEASVQARVELERFALRLSQRALNDDAEGFVASLDSLTEELGRLMGVDAVYVDEVTAAMQIINLAGWSAPDLEFGLGKRPPIRKLTHYPGRLRVLTSLEPLFVNDASEFDGGVDWEHIDGIADRGRAIIPMSVGGQLRGVLGLVTTRAGRVWTADERGVLPLLGATIASVLERRNLDRALRASEARFRLLSEQAADVVTLADSEFRLIYVSPSSVEVLGHEPEQLLGVSLLDLVYPDDLGIMSGIRNDFLSGAPVRFEIRVRHKDGHWVWISNSAKAIRGADGRVEYWGSLRDITERKRLEAELEFQALHDPLTGLANRTLLQSRLEVALARRGEPNPVSLLLIDLDGFKEVNDAHGHLAGDYVLCELAARLKAVTRPSDTLARTGGDEFVLICPETSVDGAVVIAERVVEELQLPVDLPTGPVTVGGSVGVACVDGHLVDPDWLMLEADRAMYEAKRSGKGCVRVSDFRPDQLV
jgi:diguanylate cyclase (GGDEF)-like protein/PAS domain S-box-containing protein